MALISLKRIAFAASALTAVVALGLSTLAYSAPLLTNGDFEIPIVPVRGFTLFTPPSTSITGWTVVGNPGTVAIVSGTFTQFDNGIDFSFRAQSGVQWLDLTGMALSRLHRRQLLTTFSFLTSRMLPAQSRQQLLASGTH
jgi:hypothetical protein